MLKSRHVIKAMLGLCLVLALASCDSAEERAEEHFQRALELIAEGDNKRAIVEFRNVFQLDGSHREARHRLAELYLELGNPQGAYSNYLRLVEQYPNDLRARIELADLAYISENWDEFERHGSKALELGPDDPRVKAFALAIAYRAAASDNDVVTRRAKAEEAVVLLEELPRNIVLRKVLVQNFMQDSEFSKALAQLDVMIEEDENNVLYWRQRLSVLAELGENAAIEDTLRRMVVLFPDDDDKYKIGLLRFLMSRQELDKAEGFLRELADAAPDDDPGPRMDLINFLSEVRGIDAAKIEVRNAIATAPNPTPFRVRGAALDFATGMREEAVATLEDVLKTADPEEETLGIRVTLAKMLLALGNEVGARARVEEVLAEDSRNAEALKMRAAWLIETDETEAAVAALRTAIDEQPSDAQAMELMSRAYMRAGRSELARDYLALAVDASDNAPEQTIRYARVLLNEESYIPAEDLLKKSLRLYPNNIELLLTLGQVYLGMDDEQRTRGIVNALKEIATTQSLSAANGLETEMINRFKGAEEAMTFLQNLSNSADATLATRVATVRARLGTGDVDGALELAQQLSDENPDSLALKSVLGATFAASGRLEEAQSIYREVLDVDPVQPNVWLALAQLTVRQQKSETGIEVVEEGLTHIPDDPNLLWAKALHFERTGDFDGSIAIYEDLYEKNSDSVIVANNLASMLSTYRQDEESLNRAWRVSRRFRDAQIPAMQDTYGWIEHRRGNSETALPYLENASQGLPGDPVVQYHLGEVYLALGRKEDALGQFKKAVDLAASDDSRPQIELARQHITSLQNAEN